VNFKCDRSEYRYYALIVGEEDEKQPEVNQEDVVTVFSVHAFEEGAVVVIMGGVEVVDDEGADLFWGDGAFGDCVD